MKLIPPIKFIPQPKKRIWGGDNLKKKLNKPFDEEKIGESWELSAIPNSISKVSSGPLFGKSFDDLIKAYKGRLIGESVYKKFGNNFPILIKFIDAKLDLSLQLHPDDKFAKKNHGSFGKKEMWYVIDAEKESNLIVGFKENITKKKYKTHLKNNTLKEILNFKNVSRGDAFIINPGVVHAIGKDIVLLEIQQSSDITYRIYDYNRKDENGNKRELHTELADKVIKLDNTDFNIYFDLKANGKSLLVNSDFFKINIFHLDGKLNLNLLSLDSFSVIICVQGELIYNYQQKKISLDFASTLFLPAEINNILLEGVNVKFFHIHL
ncbi:MAG: class I mannose-6-phosphate isomerase [Flavobacteriaceae bacterium]|nr:class I mannose-6-phosphate isomerase [Flavobacteriaceae bacterium]